MPRIHAVRNPSARRNPIARIALMLCAAISVDVMAPSAGAQQSYPKLTQRDWPWWRGPQFMGEANADKPYPLQWDETTNIRWRVPVPGRGQGTPIVVGDFVYIATCDEGTGAQGVLCVSRDSGALQWHREVHASGAMRKNAKSSGASSTLACDGERLYINFANADRVVLSALDLSGSILWQTDVCAYQIHQGYGASPLLYRDLVVSVADTKGGGAVVACNRVTGQTVWKRDRPSNPNYPSPVVFPIGGKDQLILIGCDEVISLDPSTGDTIWQKPGATTECVTTTVTDGVHVFSSGGYPRNHLAAYRADRGGELAWETGDRVYVPSLLIRKGNLFGVLDAGIAVCWDAATGKERWKHRLGGDISASPVLVGDRIYATNEAGTTYVYEANPDAFRLLATNQLGNEAFATATFVDGQIFTRIAQSNDASRQEFLVCIATLKESKRPSE
ncbi:MAG: PQQ-binding-like beta-propeller repeat protein [Pirellula sp.]